MLIRRDDFGDISKLKNGSHKKIWFTCESCEIGVLQEYRNYVKQENGKFCRRCRNKHTSNRKDVKQKTSKYMKNRWRDEKYREEMSRKLSKACKDAWDNDDGSRRKKLSENNPMKKPDIVKKVSKSESISIEDIKKVLDSYNYRFIERKFVRGGSYIYFECDKGHRTGKHLHSFRSGHFRCNVCSKVDSLSEKEVSIFLNQIGFDHIRNDRKLIYPYEIDILIPSKKMCIEYCGLYWHSESKGKNRKYHLNKLEMCENKGYRLITIFEDEWVYKRDIVKSRLKHILGLSDTKIYARNCLIKEISTKEAREFVEKYHLQGYRGSSIKIGALYEGRLVSVMTFSKPSISKGSKSYKNGTWELNRFCSSCTVVGIASKLLSYFKRKYEWKEIFSFADRRWSDGSLYEKIGFHFSHDTQPNYWYHHGNEQRRIHRFSLRKTNNEPEHITESCLRKEQGYNRIWDCGNKKYVIKKTG